MIKEVYMKPLVRFCRAVEGFYHVQLELLSFGTQDVAKTEFTLPTRGLCKADQLTCFGGDWFKFDIVASYGWSMARDGTG